MIVDEAMFYKIADEFRSGLTAKQISEKLGIPISGLSAIRKVLGIPRYRYFKSPWVYITKNPPKLKEEANN